MKRMEIFNSLLKIQELLWEDGDRLDQDTLFEVQEELAIIVLDIAKDIKKVDFLLEKYPWLYERS